jgi:Golgi phosphoprotein 3 (GPP34)
VTRLSGTGLVADDLYLMAHDDVTGRPFLQPRAAGLGLAAGLLAELTLVGRIAVWQGWLVPADPAPLPDPLGQAVLGLLTADRERHPISDWLAFLARTAAADVAVRLDGAGYLTKTSPRRPWRGERWVPVDADCAFAPVARARRALDAAQTPVYSAVLAGLAVACGLGSRLLPYGPPDARLNLGTAVEHLPPGVRELIAQAQVAVDSAVLAQRL